MSKRRAIIVTDLGFGDAGKGLITDALVRELGAHTVVRFNGGAQAGHNVVLADGRHHTFSQFGAGTFVPGVATVLSKHVALHPTSLLVEAERLARLGVGEPLARVIVDERARVTTPFHQAANRLREMARGERRHGSCGIGFGETIADAEAGFAITAANLRDKTSLRAALLATQERKRAEIEEVMRLAPSSPDAEREKAFFSSKGVVDAWLDRLAPVVGSVRIAGRAEMARVLARDGTTIFEGAQGVLLDEWYGFHPHTTWSTCTFKNAEALLREHDYTGSVTRLGVLRTYAVRHGAGPLPTEVAGLADVLEEPHNVLGPWQGHVRRGFADLVLLSYAVRVSGGVDALAVTHLDALRRMPAPSIATRYRDKDSMVDDLPVAPPPDLAHQERLTRLLERVTPEIVRLAPGGGAEFDLLQRLEAAASAKVAITSGGPRAEDVNLAPDLVASLEG